MSKYLVETYYTCTFKIVNTLDELNEKKLSELESSKDGEVEVIDVRLNNRKTKKIGKNQNIESPKNKIKTSDIPEISAAINKTITSKDNLNISNEINNNDLKVQKLINKK